MTKNYIRTTLSLDAPTKEILAWAKEKGFDKSKFSRDAILKLALESGYEVTEKLKVEGKVNELTGEIN